MSNDPPGRLPQREFDAKAAYAAIEELRPFCRTAYILFTWDQYNPQQIVDYWAAKGIAREVFTFKKLLADATRQCLQRQARRTPKHSRRLPSSR